MSAALAIAGYGLRESLRRRVFAVVLVLTSCVGDGPSWRDLGGICATPRAGVDRQGTLDDEKKLIEKRSTKRESASRKKSFAVL